ncbi:MAG: response regulator transcription factor [Clostridiales bacterium]|nr:response regulator transcription factor [Clostridiales bacterium]
MILLKVEININPEIEETKIVIHAKEITNEVTKLANSLTEENINTIIGFLDDKVYILDKKDIESFYTEDNKIFARNKDQKKYYIKYRMYELEESLKNTSFIRISNSEIINFNEVRNLDLGIIGTIIVNFKSGNTAYVSRRNVAKIKKYLNI